MTIPLEQQARDLLARMSVLSDARSVSYIPTDSARAHESSGTRGPGHVAPDDDLLTKWAQRFADPGNADRLASLVLLARREVEQRVRRKPQQLSDTKTSDGGEQHETPWERDNRIIDWYEGVPADEAAIIESACGTHCPANNIRKVRCRNDCDAELGRRQTPREQRQRVARELRAANPRWSLRRIAEEMNVSLATVQTALRPDDEQQAQAA